MFVRQNSLAKIERQVGDELENIVADFLRQTRQRGFTDAMILEKLKRQIQREIPTQILLIEDDADLREILRCEIAGVTTAAITVGSSFNVMNKGDQTIVALTETVEKLPHINNKIVLRFNSVQRELSGKTRPPDSAIIAIASSWLPFLSWAQTILLAAGIEPEQLLLRDSKTADWQRGLPDCQMIIADSLTARSLPNDARVRIFRLLADESIAQLKTW